MRAAPSRSRSRSDVLAEVVASHLVDRGEGPFLACMLGAMAASAARSAAALDLDASGATAAEYVLRWIEEAEATTRADNAEEGA